MKFKNLSCWQIPAVIGHFMANSLQKPLKTLLVSALILVNKANKVLLAQRPAGKDMAGLWEFPGGKVKKNEDLKEALVREINEELAIRINPGDLKPVMTLEHDYPDFRLKMPMFLARTWQGEITPLEGQELAWVKPENLSRYPMPPADLPLVRRMSEILEKF